MIDFTLNPAQQTLRSNALLFASQVLSHAPTLYNTLPTQAARFRSLRPLYRQAVEAGLIKGQIPAPLGGTGGSLVDAAILVEAVYATDPSAALTIFGTGLGLLPLILGGSAEQHEKFFKPFLSGEGESLASLVSSEPDGTANYLQVGGRGLGTTARREGEEWVVSGEKLWATNSGGWDGRGADLQCVLCRDASVTNAEDPASAVLVIIVTRDDIAANPQSAYTIISDPELPGHPATSGPHSKFTDLRVPASNVLAPPGKGAQLIEQAFSMSASLVGAMSVAIMNAAFNAALRFAKTDTRGGKLPIIHHQSVADILIDAKMKIETSRLLTWKALHALENGPGDVKARAEMSYIAKIYASEASVQVCVEVMKAVGMTSYTKEAPYSRLLNDAMCLPLFDGGNVGIRRRQIEKIMQDDAYEPIAATY